MVLLPLENKNDGAAAGGIVITRKHVKREQVTRRKRRSVSNYVNKTFMSLYDICFMMK